MPKKPKKSKNLRTPKKKGNPVLEKLSAMERRMATIDDLESLNKNFAEYLSKLEGDSSTRTYLKAVTDYMKDVLQVEAKLIERQESIDRKLEEIKKMLGEKNGGR